MLLVRTIKFSAIKYMLLVRTVKFSAIKDVFRKDSQVLGDQIYYQKGQPNSRLSKKLSERTVKFSAIKYIIRKDSQILGFKDVVRKDSLVLGDQIYYQKGQPNSRLSKILSEWTVKFSAIIMLSVRSVKFLAIMMLYVFF